MKTRNPWPASAGRKNQPPMADEPYVITASGRAVSLVNPLPAQIAISDIAAGLAKINRWAGASFAPYSVAQHLVWCSRHCARGAEQHAFAHDWHEAYTGDIASPMKAAIGVAAVAAIEARLDAAIFAKLGLPAPTESMRAAVRQADMLALATERRDLLPPCPVWRQAGFPAPHPDPIKPLPWSRAQDAFMARFHELFGSSEL